MVRKLEIEGLDAESLRKMYLVDLLTETQIASRFGITQVQVGRYRKKFGIPTLSLGDRVGQSLPASLTEHQSQLLVGSLLGDGWMKATSAQSASFHEGHCLKQAPYTDWKAGILAPFATRTYQGSKKHAGKVFYSHNLATRSCPQLRPFFDLFYPSPEHKRVFPESLPSLMTPFVLAVWYMDDGNVTANGFPRIAFGLDDKSLVRAIKALKGIGLNPTVYGEGSNKEIHFPKQALLFRDLIAPHVPDCMQYKLPFESDGQKLHRLARQLTADTARSLYEGGLSVAKIADMHKVGESTVKRRLAQAGVAMRPSGPRRLTQDHTATLALLDDIGRRSVLSGTTEAMVDEALTLLRSLPFPAPSLGAQPKEEAMQALRDVAKALSDKGALTVQRAGIALCTAMFPNRYHARSRGVKSAYQAWHMDADLRKAIAFQLKVQDPVLPHRVLRAVTMACRTPSVFRPVVAGTLYKTYCPAGGLVWDPCSGYGGRLLGAVAAGVRYIGTDVDPDTVSNNNKLAALLGAQERAQVHLCPAQDFNPPPVDMVFTSPPYFNRELYSDGKDQSWRMGSFEAWLEGFLAPVVAKAYAALSPGGYLLLNVSDVRDKTRKVPLVQATVDTAVKQGFVLERTLEMPLAKLNRNAPSEPVLVFRVQPL